MAKKQALQAIRGMNDCLPSETNIWQTVETVLRRVASNYGFAEIKHYKTQFNTSIYWKEIYL